MCGRFAQPLDIHAIQSQLIGMNIPVGENVDEPRDQTHHFNISPTNSTPIYFTTGIETNLMFMRWGVIPSWVHSWDDVKKTKLSTFNTRLENINGKLWKHCERCVIPITGYFEWKEKKMPYYVTNKDALMLLAGVYSKVEVNNKDVYSFSVVTTSADKQLDWLHHRMPLIIERGQVENWLKGKENIVPYTSELDSFKVDPAVGNTKLDEAKFVKPFKTNKIDDFFSNKPKVKVEHEEKKLNHVKREHEDDLLETKTKKVKKEGQQRLKTD